MKNLIDEPLCIYAAAAEACAASEPFIAAISILSSMLLSNSLLTLLRSFVTCQMCGAISAPMSKIIPESRLKAWSVSDRSWGAHGMKKQDCETDVPLER